MLPVSFRFKTNISLSSVVIECFLYIEYPYSHDIRQLFFSISQHQVFFEDCSDESLLALMEATTAHKLCSKVLSVLTLKV